MRMLVLVLALISFMVLPQSTFAHGGGLDSYGGHNDRKHGGYHFHRGALAGKSYSSKAAALAALRKAAAPKPQPVAGPVDKKPDPAELIRKATTTKKLHALISILVRKKLMTEAELAAEIVRSK